MLDSHTRVYLRSSAGITYLSTQSGIHENKIPSEASQNTAVIFLHGIGSNAMTWTQSLTWADSRGLHAYSWNAPGYGWETFRSQSASAQTTAFTDAFWSWIDSVDELRNRQLHIVGHSLGALMAGAIACHRPKQLKTLNLLAPALGYATHTPAQREEVRLGRYNNFIKLGHYLYAEQRSADMFFDPAHSERSTARWMMEQLQASCLARSLEFLVGGDLLNDLATLKREAPTLEIHVAVGKQDKITRPEQCAQAQQYCSTPMVLFDNCGHACPLESPTQIHNFLAESLCK